MALRKVVFKATNTVASCIASTVTVTLPSGQNVTMGSTAASSTIPDVATTVAAAINAGVATSNGKPIKASVDGNDIYVALVEDSASSSFSFGLSNAVNLSSWTKIIVEDPYVDATAGMYSGAALAVSIAAAFSAAKLVK
jgi:hypothetical protein